MTRNPAPRPIRAAARALLLSAAIGMMMLSGCGTPQIGPDDESFQAVDALYTAVSLHDAARTEQCGKTLDALHAQGRLPESAYRRLHAITTAMPRDPQSWEGVRVALRDFMKGQRGS